MLYTEDDDVYILKAIIDSEAYYCLRGTIFWRRLAQDENFTTRTMEGLKTRFLRYIFPNINKYSNISLLERRKIEVAMAQTSRDFSPSSDSEEDESETPTEE